MKVSPLWAAIVMLASCSDGTGPNNGVCPQTHEFGNFGCARVQGVVRDGAGKPIAGAQVILFPPADSGPRFNAPVDESDANGAYSVEVHDFGGSASEPAPPLDPIPMNLRAYSHVDSITPLSSELVSVNLKFAPVGKTPESQQVDLTIP